MTLPAFLLVLWSFSSLRALPTLEKNTLLLHEIHIFPLVFVFFFSLCHVQFCFLCQSCYLFTITNISFRLLSLRHSYAHRRLSSQSESQQEANGTFTLGSFRRGLCTEGLIYKGKCWGPSKGWHKSHDQQQHRWHHPWGPRMRGESSDGSLEGESCLKKSPLVCLGMAPAGGNQEVNPLPSLSSSFLCPVMCPDSQRVRSMRENAWVCTPWSWDGWRERPSPL